MAIAASSRASSIGTTLQALQAQAGNPLGIARILQQNEKGSNTGKMLQTAQATESATNSLALLQSLQPVNSDIYKILQANLSGSIYMTQARLSAQMENAANADRPDILDTLMKHTGEVGSATVATDQTDSQNNPIANLDDATDTSAASS
jgi:hypothetical protein